MTRPGSAGKATGHGGSSSATPCASRQRGSGIPAALRDEGLSRLAQTEIHWDDLVGRHLGEPGVPKTPTRQRGNRELHLCRQSLADGLDRSHPERPLRLPGLEIELDQWRTTRQRFGRDQIAQRVPLRVGAGERLRGIHLDVNQRNREDSRRQGQRTAPRNGDHAAAREMDVPRQHGGADAGPVYGKLARRAVPVPPPFPRQRLGLNGADEQRGQDEYRRVSVGTRAHAESGRWDAERQGMPRDERARGWI